MSIDYMEAAELCRVSQETGSPGEFVHLMLSGHPGVGKNHLWQMYADLINYKLTTIILTNEDNLDIGGMWAPNFEEGKLNHLMTDRFMGDNIPEGFVGEIILFDEIGNAPHMQTAILSIIEDRRHNGKPVGVNVIFGFSTNMADVGCGASRINNALQARILNFIVEPECDKWMDWALDNDLHPKILTWLEYSKHSLHNFDPKSKEFGQPNPRSWHKLSGLMYQEPSYQMFKQVAVGMVGSVEGMKFIGFTQLDEGLTSVHDILGNPEGCHIPTDDVSSQYAIVSNVSAWMIGQRKKEIEITTEEKEAFITFIRRFVDPLAVFAFRLLDRMNPDFAKCKAYSQFTIDYQGCDL
jgi:hypothetical protein